MYFKKCNNDDICCATCTHWYTEEDYNMNTFPVCQKHDIKLDPHEFDYFVCDVWEEPPEPSSPPKF